MLKKKLKLRLEELRIEQFQIWPESVAVTQRGTVRGLAETEEPWMCSIDPIHCVDAPISWYQC